jgi:hypothetical protein
MAPPFAMIPLAALMAPDLTYRMLKVFGAICSFRKDSADFFIEAGRDEIASRCGLNASIVSTATTELQRLGWLIKQGAGGRGLKTTYTITIPETVSTSETVTKSETVLKYETVSESETVAESASKTVSTSGTLLYKKEVNTDKRVSKCMDSEPESFATFWEQYPKKVAKPQALKAWKKIKPAGQVLASLMAALEKQKASADWQKDAGQFIPFPASWLNGRRWEDEAPPAADKTAAPVRNPIFAGAI